MSKPANLVKKKAVPDPLMDELEIGNAIYLTRLTRKFKNRKTWERPDIRMLPAVIPGTIQKIMAKEGEKVKQGTPLLILEAMKMKNEIQSPMEGVIKKIHISEGQQVSKEQLLVEFF